MTDFKIPDEPDTDALWDALHKYVKYEPLRVVRVGWSS